MELQAARTVLEGIAQVAGQEGPEEQPAADLSLRREGDYWSVVFEGRTVRMRDLKGMRYLARLLAHPGREFHVLDLGAIRTGTYCAYSPDAPAPRGWRF